MTKTIVFIAEKINLSKILAETPPAFPYQIDNFKYILNLLTLIPAYQKNEEDTEYIPLNAVRLQRVIRHYSLYLSYLLDNGIIETDGKVIPNLKSRGFRIAEQYQSPVKVSFITDSRLNRKLSRKHFTIQDNGLEHLSKWFNSGLQIDYEAAMQFNENQLLNTDCDVFSWEQFRKYNVNLFNIEHFTRENYRFKQDDTSKRVHTNLTSLSRGLRKFITYQKNGLVNVDLKCSQPFFLSILLCADFYSDNPLYQLNLTAIEQYSPKELRSTKQLQNGIIERVTNWYKMLHSILTHF